MSPISAVALADDHLSSDSKVACCECRGTQYSLAVRFCPGTDAPPRPAVASGGFRVFGDHLFDHLPAGARVRESNHATTTERR